MEIDGYEDLICLTARESTSNQRSGICGRKYFAKIIRDSLMEESPSFFTKSTFLGGLGQSKASKSPEPDSSQRVYQ